MAERRARLRESIRERAEAERLQSERQRRSSTSLEDDEDIALLPPWQGGYIKSRKKKQSVLIKELEAGRDPKEIVGPLGGFFKREEGRDAVDILKSRLADETSRPEYPSQSVRIMHCKKIKNSEDYAAPSDRIARLYSPAATRLNMHEASRISKQDQQKKSTTKQFTQKTKGKSNNLDTLFHCARLAPAAYAVSPLHLSADGTDVEAFHNKPRPQSSGSILSTEKTLHFTEASDYYKQRETARRLRGKGLRLLAPTSPSAFTAKGFDPEAWDPQKLSNKNNVVKSQPAQQVATLISEAKAHQVAVDNFWARVQEVLTSGTPHAAGAGRKRQLAQLPDKWLGGVAARVSPPQALLDQRRAMAEARLSSTEEPLRGAELAAETALDEARHSFGLGLARACVEYELRDPKHATSLNIDANYLHAAPRWWCSLEFTAPEWRILRCTGVSNRSVRLAYIKLGKTLGMLDPVVRNLQRIWLEPGPARLLLTEEIDSESKLPPSPPKSNDAASQSMETKTAIRPAYSQVMLTDLDAAAFRSRLPLPLDVFCTHLERHAASVRESLRDEWLTEAAGLLTDHLANTVEAVVSHEDQVQQEEEDDDEPPAAEEEFDAWFARAYGIGTGSGEKKNLKKKSDLTLTTISTTSHREEQVASPTKDTNRRDEQLSDSHHPRSSIVIECAATLMSRQLRELCEASLGRLVAFFERFDSPVCTETGEAAFELTLRLNESIDNAVHRTSSAVDPGPVVHIEPSLQQLEHHCCLCVDSIVAAVQRFPRAETVFTQQQQQQQQQLLQQQQQQQIADNESNNGEEAIDEAATMLTAPAIVNETKSSYLGPCVVSLDDACVVEAKARLRAALARRFEGPAKLVTLFDEFAPVLTGRLGEDISNTVAKGRRFAVAARIESKEDKRLKAEATEDSLNMLLNQCESLSALTTKIKSVTPDLCNFAMFQVVASGVKEQLVARVEALRSCVTDAVSSDNRDHMNEICRTYHEVAEALVDEPTTTAELRALKEYSDKAVGVLHGLAKEYAEEILSRTTFLLRQNHRGTKDDLAAVAATHAWPANIRTYIQRSDELQETRKRHLKMVVEGQREQLGREVNNLEKKLEKLADSSSLAPSEVQMAIRRVQAVREGLAAAQTEAELVASQEELLELTPTDHETRLAFVAKELAPLDKLWTVAREWVDRSRGWREMPLPQVDAEEAAQKAAEYASTLNRIVKQLEKKGESRAPSRRACKLLLQEIGSFDQDEVPLLRLVSEQGMCQRHWDEIKRITRLNFENTPQTNLAALTDIGLHQYVHLIEDVCVAAAKEAAIDKTLHQMADDWIELEFRTKEWRSARILAGIDEIQQELDDQIVKTQAMRGSRYVKPFIDRVEEWENTLQHLQNIIDNWINVQAAWLYLEPIFSSEDINRQMPTEARLFVVVNAVWKESMEKTKANPAVLAVAQREGLLESLIDASERLETIQKGLNAYLESKRILFPRFFFLSNDELLSILAETKDPLLVQPHLRKLFDGITNLEFNEAQDILAAFDGPIGRSERLEFAYQDCDHKLINPKDSAGNVELWLLEVEVIMKKSLAHALDLGLVDFEMKSERGEWLKSWQGQTILTVNQITWVRQVEKAITEGGGDSLRKLHKTRVNDLLDVVRSVRGDIPKSLRQTLGALVVMDVHNRDVTMELAESENLKATTDFEWQAHLRYYVHHAGGDSHRSALTGLPGTVECRMINASILYAYEYVGNCGRLVITPLTDRCYRTLMGAIHLNLGGAPEGPAGTGKTETTKDLAKAVAIQCIVTNCSDSLDYKTMGKFFRGLASSGAWACFDEFNRISLEVLSVIAQQVLTIQQAKARGVEHFLFEGADLPLKPTCAPFITMNPGYAGRAELPDNLKVLFRTVAMMVPDYAMIGEILLYSMGYADAKALAIKIVTTYKLCSEQLSSQSHYDYGMRAVMAVLRAAGNLKRAEGHLPEDILVLRSIIDVNLPKFLSPDVPLFEGITSDLFPGVNIAPPDRSAMYTAFEDACLKRLLQPTQYFWEKVVQIYDMMVVRHGFMIVGMPFSGKSSAWKVLADVLSLLHERFPEDVRWTKVWPLVQNPKSVNMGQLYGQFDPVSTEWTDGCLAINYRNAVQSKIPGAVEADRKWILLDGPVDAIWIENMNTVLDDNKKLCLMSGEIIAMSDTMSMIFEPMDLLVASPATVSRCGMVYMEPEKLGWQPILDSWLEKWSAARPLEDSEDSSDVFELNKADQSFLRTLFGMFVEPCLAFVRREIKEMSPTVDSGMVVSLLNLFREILGAGIPGRGPKSQEVESSNSIDPDRRKQLSSGFLFSLIWSVGVTASAEGRRKFSFFLRDLLNSGPTMLDKPEYAGVLNALMVRKWERPEGEEAKPFDFELPIPETSDVQDWCYDPKQGKWLSWLATIPNFEIPNDVDTAQILVPTACTAQISYIMKTLIPRGVRPLVVGPTGTGKSMCVMKSITSELPQDKFKTIALGFSAKTSANMTQGIIDGSLTKRRKGVFGPPPGQQAIIFIDDINLPEVETYGAQPPIELLRQIIDNGGCYDLKEMTFATIQDCVFVGAMGPSGGGRNPTTPRFLRHFSLVCVDEFDDKTLRRIFSTIVDHAFGKLDFPDDIRSASSCVVDATLHAYREVMKCLLPTPSKSHYVYNLRDFARAIQGVLMIQPSPEFEDKTAVMRLWTHEALRVFSDRLVDDTDRDWFVERVVKTSCRDIFKLDFDNTFSHLSTVKHDDSAPVIGSAELRRLFFGEYMTSIGEEIRPYAEIQDMSLLQQTMDQYLTDYNAMSKKPMDLVLFAFAVEHVSRISRILRMPGGNALLIGVGGSGRQSLTTLAADIAGHALKRIELTRTYSPAEWREDMKRILCAAGTGDRPVTFLLSDTQIAFESMVEDVNNVLNSGMIPNLFPNDEKMAICEAVRVFAKERFGRAAADMSVMQLFNFFVSRVRSQLHIVLGFSPIGDAFRERLRKFPSLVNCCALNWFMSWPSDALLAVAEKFLSDVKLDDSIRPPIVATCQRFHDDVKALSVEYKAKTGRITYVTPTSYLELILAFKLSLGQQRERILAQRQRYNSGLEQLAAAEASIGEMQVELTDLQPILQQSKKDTDALMAEIEAKLPGVREQEEIVGAEAKVAQEEADMVQKQVDEVQADLDEAMPALEAAIAALDTIKPSEIGELKALSKPPQTVKLVCEAVCVMLGEKPQRIPDPDDPSKRIMDFWGPSQKMLGDKNFVDRLKSYDKDNIQPKIVEAITKKYMSQDNFTPDAAAKASMAVCGMCKWVFAMITYDRVAKIVAPKKESLAKAQASLSVTMEALDKKKSALKLVQDDLGALQDRLKAAEKKKADLEAQSDLCAKKLIRAKQLISDLGGEKSKWQGFVRDLSDALNYLTGDVLVGAGLMAYLGPFSSLFRNKMLEAWIDHCKDLKIPIAEKPTLAKTLGEATTIQQWIVRGLPTDSFSIDNAITVFNSRRWPLMIDPQNQAERWIRSMYENELVVKKVSDDDVIRPLESAVQFGKPFLLTNVQETLDSTLDPILLKQTFKQGGTFCVKLGDSAPVEWSSEFRFFAVTKLNSPHFLPEVAVKVCLLNFVSTPEGLSDQLLGVVVEHERPDLATAKSALVVQRAENASKLKALEDQTLELLSGEENVLESEAAINALQASKQTSDEIQKSSQVAAETEREIDETRSVYEPIAWATQILFFTIFSLDKIEPTYSYSLRWFINLFVTSIVKSGQSNDLNERLVNLGKHFDYSLYRNVCQSLLEKDKILFAFYMAVKKLASRRKNLNDDAEAYQFDANEWNFLLTGGVALNNDRPNACSDWLLGPQWDAICRLSDLEAFSGLDQDFAKQPNAWKAYFNSKVPHEEPLPAPWNERVSKGLRPLCIIRCLRPEKVTLGIQKFVGEALGQEFLRPPPVDLASALEESNASLPLVFVLSPGSDPMRSILEAAERQQVEVIPISLGQGQGPVAERLLAKAQKEKSWVVLQNCHLAPSFMPRLEMLCEELAPENENFRLWCTTYPSPVFPVSILQNSVKMTVEPPKGLRANLIGSFTASPLTDEGYLESGCPRNPEAFRKLVYALCLFHAILQERRLFGPLGWNIPYGFNASDLHISLQQVRMFLNENDDVPFNALQYCIGENNYGGRVTDAKDRQTLTCILKRVLNSKALEAGSAFSPSGTYVVPDAATLNGFMAVVESLPLVAEPEIFGLHANANITKDTQETEALLSTIIAVESGGGASTGGEQSSKTDETILNTATDILNKLPSENFDLEEAQIKYPVDWSESRNTVLLQELAKFNNLTSLIRTSLHDVIRAVQGVVVMSEDLEHLGKSLVVGAIPALWRKASYPSFKPLAGYVNDLLARLGFMSSWLHDKPPVKYWISVFFFTHSFLTATRQNMARAQTIPIDALGFRFEMLKGTDFKKPPKRGVYTFGLFIEGARWDPDAHILAESTPKVLYVEAPLMWFEPMKTKNITHPPSYSCPVYKTGDRRGVLATTGHSTNFILDILLPSELPQSHWVQRGVAMLTQLAT